MLGVKKKGDNMIKDYFFPVVDKDVQQMMDRTSTKSVETISLVVTLFEAISLALFMFTRKSFGSNEWTSFFSVMFCIVACLVAFFIAKRILDAETIKHLPVAILNTLYFIIMAIWAMWSSQRRYELGEQILTFYAVEVMLVCFIVLKPWFSIIITMGTYGLLYAMLFWMDGAAGVYPVNFFLLSVVCAICMTVRYHGLLKTSRATIQLQKAKDSEIQDKVNILQAIADIYDKVNLIDFNDCTEMSIRDKDQIKLSIDPKTQTHTQMTQNMRKRIMPDQLESFIEYTDITTIRSRLTGKRLLSNDFIDIVEGWFRAQYIPVDVDEEGVPQRVVFTTRTVDSERRREEHLYRIAMTDELTRLFNRRSYEEDLEVFREQGMDKGFVILSADVNGLKKVNDTKGHAGGDELIKGAADCLLLGIGERGKVYRTGGDEFTAILHTDDPKGVCHDIKEMVKNWHGKYSDELSVSIGFAARSDDENLSIDELERKADKEMYAAKAGYYAKRGIDRRTS
jgi:diguanylate cyclase (GGDEF)-like protein